MSSMRVFVPICLLLAVTVEVSLHRTEAAVSCNTVVSDLYPCLGYLTQGGTVPANCCNGVKTLNMQAQTPSARQDVCRCIKSALGGVSYTSKNLKNAASLPSKCGVKLAYKIDPSTNCNSIK